MRGTQQFYAFAADLMLVVHVLFVIFIVFGLVLILAGRLLSWQWVRNRWFRVSHLIGIGVVVLQSWFGLICPLTIWEMNLRSKAGEAVYEGSFIANVLNELLYYQAPAWVFVISYTAFGGLVLLSWIWIPPTPFRTRAGSSSPERIRKY